MVLTQMADCSSFGNEGLPLPCEEEYQKALEEIVKAALGAQTVEWELKRNSLCSLLKNTRTGRERFSSSNYTEAVKKATEEAFFKCEQCVVFSRWDEGCVGVI